MEYITVYMVKRPHGSSIYLHLTREAADASAAELNRTYSYGDGAYSVTPKIVYDTPYPGVPIPYHTEGTPSSRCTCGHHRCT